jgi:hypothetical protein
MDVALAYFAVHSSFFPEAKEVGKQLFDPFARSRVEELKERGLEVPFASAKDLFVARRVAEDDSISKGKAMEEWKTVDHEPWTKQHQEMKEAFAKAEKQWMVDKVNEAAKIGEAEAKKLEKKQREQAEKEEAKSKKPAAAASEKKKADDASKSKKDEDKKAATARKEAAEKQKKEEEKKKAEAEKKKLEAQKKKQEEIVMVNVEEEEGKDSDSDSDSESKKKKKKQKKAAPEQKKRGPDPKEASAPAPSKKTKAAAEDKSEQSQKKANDEGSFASQGLKKGTFLFFDLSVIKCKQKELDPRERLKPQRQQVPRESW